jgi:hypothetical protein
LRLKFSSVDGTGPFLQMYRKRGALPRQKTLKRGWFSEVLLTQNARLGEW